MHRIILIAFFIGIAATATANTMRIVYSPKNSNRSILDVYISVQGDNTGILNYDIAVRNITTVPGLSSTAITYEFSRLGNLNSSFVPVGFQIQNNIEGPSGANHWSAGASQFNAANPLVGLGRSSVFVEAAPAPVPGNGNIDVQFVSFPYVLGSKVGTLDLGIGLTDDQLARVLGGGGTVFDGSASRPIALSSPASVFFFSGFGLIPVYPEPTAGVLAGLALVSAAGRRRV